MINDRPPLVSVLMPTYKHANFIGRAIQSLLVQTFREWELIIVNDGSPDDTEEVLQEFMHDRRVSYRRNGENMGLGHCLNVAMSLAAAPFITYLPSDDVMYKDHLASLVKRISSQPEAALVYSNVKHYYNRKTGGAVAGEWLQLVQVMHHKTDQRWTARNELESDDLDRLFWNKLEGDRVPTGLLTCEWVDHPHQRHKIMREPLGGINTFRSFYEVRQPLIFHTTRGNYMNEVDRYEGYRATTYPTDARGGLKILLVGELAYNAERVLALAEQGHRLYGLWMQQPYWYNYVGPLPFGHVTDIAYYNWRQQVEDVQPDIIYGLLNWQAVPLCHEVLMANTGIPFVWHFKEGPFICMEKGTWSELMDLYNKADGRIYNSQEMQTWLEGFIRKQPHSLDWVFDGDLPKMDWFQKERSPLLSAQDNNDEFHTVVPGRPIGLHPHNVVELAEQKIHLHFYGDFTHGQWKEWIDKTNRMAPGYLHIHPNVDQENWVEEFSKYDAGWLHFFKSENNGEITRANWDDLNIPARLPTLALSGVPLLQANNEGHIVSIQSLVRELGIGLLFNDMKELAQLLRNRPLMTTLRENVWQQRDQFTFDHHAKDLINYFKAVIEATRQKTSFVMDDELSAAATVGRS